ncbi:MATE family efflux transporter [Phreatobacter sp.]|uniref:MATE family efflux transporter n=1 Tax=Phreatobacter sp. TaxID=1966341 RepID=UPI0025F865A9|nr:MATE family efflux transporter [Phreatobacter sp.]
MSVTPTPAGNPILTAPIVTTILRLSTPNMMAMVATAAVAIAETAYVGLLGTAALAGMALVFPMVMLQQMMSAGAMGGGVSSAVSRALGAGDVVRARSLAYHTVLIALAGGLGMSALFLAIGPALYRLLGGRGAALEQALVYSNVIFAGILAVWLCNLLASVVRGMGNMAVPSSTLLAVAAIQIVVGGGLGLGLGPLPRLGMVGVGLGQVIAYGLGALWLLRYLRSGKGRFVLPLSGLPVRFDHAADILRVGTVAMLASFQSVLTVLILTRLVATFGEEALAGYGIGSRLEFLLIPVTFAIGVSLVPMVGMAIGSGNAPRARRAAWTGGAMAFAITGTVGFAAWLVPEAWARLFTSDPAVIAAARSYLVWAGPGFGFYGLGLCLYFAAQGAGRVFGPVMAGTARLAVIAIGGWWLAATGQPAWTMFALVGFAMVVYGLVTMAVIWTTRWGR